MRRRRFWITPALALTMTLALAACGEQDDPSAAPSEGETTRSGPCANEVGVTDTTITIGQSMGLSGALAAFAEAANAGFDTYIDQVNADGGIDGRKIEVVRVDNEFKPDTSLTRFRELEPKVAMLTSQGSGPTNAILADISSTCMPTVVFGNAGVNALDEHTTLYGTPYAYHAINGMAWAVQEQGATGKWGIIYQDDPAGNEVLKATEAAAEELGVELAAKAPFAYPTDADFSGQIRTMKNAGVTWITLAGLAPSSFTIVSQAAAAGLDVKWMSPQMAWSGTAFDSPVVDSFDANDVYFVTCCSGWNSSDAAGLAEAKEAITANHDVEGFDPLVGYVWAKAVVEVLRAAAESGDFSRGGITEAIGSERSVDMGGLACDWQFGEEGQPNNPTRASMVTKISADTAPDGMAQVKDCFVSDAAKKFSLSELR